MRISHEYGQRTCTAHTDTGTHWRWWCACGRAREYVYEFSRTNIQYGIRLHIGAHARTQTLHLLIYWACRRISFSCLCLAVSVSLALSAVYLYIYSPSSFTDSTLTLTLTLALILPHVLYSSNGHNQINWSFSFRDMKQKQQFLSDISYCTCSHPILYDVCVCVCASKWVCMVFYLFGQSFDLSGQFNCFFFKKFNLFITIDSSWYVHAHQPTHCACTIFPKNGNNFFC